ncbi:MAG: hypothetical protein G8237_13870 [Magnetococcales bacterium]|nr:hypothetical protein [Magnetococcales bacterium]
MTDHAQGLGRVHQLQAAYAPAEDRLLLRINTSDHMEFRFWLTRRFVQRLWPALRQTLEMQPDVAGMEQSARGFMLDFMHEQATAAADFQAPFQEAPNTVMPLGNQPILAVQARIAAVPGHDQLRRFHLHPAQGYGIEVAMDMQLLHAFCKLLADAVTAAEWQLDLTLSPVMAHLVSPAEGKRILH